MAGKYHKTAKLYSYNVAVDTEKSGYVARVAEFPTISVRGETEKSALKYCEREVAETLYDMYKGGAPIPVPFKKR